MSDTPRTDEVLKERTDLKMRFARMTQLAQDFERELAELRVSFSDLVKRHAQCADESLDASRYRWTRPLLFAQGNEGDRRALRLAGKLMQGLEDEAAIDAAMSTDIQHSSEGKS